MSDKYPFLAQIVGNSPAYTVIIDALKQEKLAFTKIADHVRENVERPHTDEPFSDRTIREKIRDLQDVNLVAKERDYTGGRRDVYYYIPPWDVFKQSTLDPIRRKMKRQIFDKVEY